MLFKHQSEALGTEERASCGARAASGGDWGARGGLGYLQPALTLFLLQLPWAPMQGKIRGNEAL